MPKAKGLTWAYKDFRVLRYRKYYERSRNWKHSIKFKIPLIIHWDSLNLINFSRLFVAYLVKTAKIKRKFTHGGVSYDKS